MREFMIGHRPVIHRAPEQNEYRGFLFQPNPGRWSLKKTSKAIASVLRALG